MTREEAATAIGWLRNGPVKVHTFLEDAFGYKVADEIMEGLKAAVTALRGPIPDPETGLVPCGNCGSAPIIEKLGAGGFWRKTKCPKGCISTDYEPADSSKITWNKAHGYKEEA
jgi:hypothetical protein